MTTIDAVLPLTVSDYDRSLVLQKSLARFVEGLGTLFIVGRGSELDQLRTRLSKLPPDGITRTLLAESDLVPELSQFKHLKGWYKQQLVKLAVFERVQSDFYLTLDADVIVTRPTSPAKLVPGGRAPCSLITEPDHEDWYSHSEQVLGLAISRRGLMHNVTPAVLATEGVRELTKHLTQRWEQRRFRPGYRGLWQRLAALRFSDKKELARWRLYLVSGVPWTEYALYYGFLEATGRFDRYHQRTDICLYDVGGSVWKKDRERFTQWDPATLFQGEGPPYFVVVQSNTRIHPDTVLDKVSPHFGGD